MSRNCWWLCKSSNHNPAADLLIHCWALIYLPTICVVSLFVVIPWLALAMNNGTFYNRDLAIVITSFAALVVLECILLVHVAVHRQRTARKSRKSCCCVDDACMQTTSTLTKNNVAIPQSATFLPEHVGEVQSQFRAQFPQSSTVKAIAESTQGPDLHTQVSSSSTRLWHPPRLLPSQKVPALCQPYHPSTTTSEITRPPTAAAYIPQPTLATPPSTMDLRSSWDLAMANNHQRSALEPSASARLASTPLPVESLTKASVETPILYREQGSHSVRAAQQFENPRDQNVRDPMLRSHPKFLRRTQVSRQV
jgi:hypothetical protein